MDVEKLVKKVKKGNKSALYKLITLEKDAYFRLAFTYMGNEQDALAALAKMTTTVYEQMNQLENVEAFYRWSKVILVNQCKQLLENRQKLVYMDEYIAVNEGKYSYPKHHLYYKNEKQYEISDMLKILNAEQKEAIQLKYFHDLDDETIAEILDVPNEKVQSIIDYGLKKLNERYRSEDDETY